jgi:hypothetical protein
MEKMQIQFNTGKNGYGRRSYSIVTVLNIGRPKQVQSRDNNGRNSYPGCVNRDWFNDKPCMVEA